MDSGEDEVAKFNRAGSDANVVLKLGLYAGSCIAVTAGGVLDYFGSTANTTARLEHQCRGGEVVVSDAVLADEPCWSELSSGTFCNTGSIASTMAAKSSGRCTCCIIAMST